MEPGDAKYWAFITYSHADEEQATWLHRALERYRVPRKLVGREVLYGPVPRRLFPIFRDRDELPSASSLTDEIEEALRSSRALLVICSPNAAASKWVNEEVKLYKRLGRDDRIFCLIVDGEPGASDRPETGLLEAFPPAVRFRLGADGELSDRVAEPIAADVREGGDGKRNSRLKLLAGILDVPYDELKQRDRRQRLVQRVQILTLVALVLAALGGLWLNRARVIEKRRQVEVARSVAEQAEAELATNPHLATLLAVEAVRRSDEVQGRPLVSAEGALRRALRSIGGRSLGGHELEVSAAAFSPDGRWLATASIGDHVRLWDLSAEPPGATPRVLRGSDAYVWALAFSPDSRRLAIGHREGAELLDLSVPEGELHEIPIPQVGVVRSLAFARDGRRLAIGDHDRAFLVSLDAGGRPSGSLSVVPGDPVVVSPSGRWVAAAGRTGFDLHLRAADNRLRRHAGPLGGQLVSDLAFDPREQWVAAANLAAGFELWRLDRLDGPFNAWRGRGGNDRVAFSPDGRWLATGGDEQALRLLDLERAGAEPDRLPGHTGSLEALAFLPDARALVGVATDGRLRMWDPERPAVDAESWFGHEDPIGWMALSADGRWLCTGDHAGKTRLWRLDSPGAEPTQLQSGRAAQFTSDGRWLVTGGSDGTIQLREVFGPDPGLPRLVRRGDAAVERIDIGPQDRWLVSTDAEGSVELWRWSDAAEPARVRTLPGEPTARIVTGIAFGPDGRWMAVSRHAGGVHLDGFVELWHLEGSAEDAVALRGAGGHEGSIGAVAFDPTGRWAATGGADGTVRLWALDAGSPVENPLVLTVHEEPKVLQGSVLTRIIAVAFSPGGRWLAAASGEGAIRVWDLPSLASSAREPVIRLDTEALIGFLGFGPDGGWLAVWAGSKVLLWDLRAPESEPRTLEATDVDWTELVFSADGRWLAMGGSSEIARLWDLRSPDPGGEPRILPGGEGRRTQVRFSPSGAWVATSGSGGARLWAVEDSAAEALVLDEEGTVETFSSDGRWVVTRREGELQLWRLAVEELVGLACEIVDRNLTRAEWAQHLGDEPYEEACTGLPVEEGTID